MRCRAGQLSDTESHARSNASTSSAADAAPHARADNTADAWSFAGADAGPHARADDARPFAGADARADAISNSG